MASTRSAVRLVAKDKEPRSGGTDYARLFECAGAAIGTISPDGRFLIVNQAFCELTGYGREELLGSSIQTLTHRDDLAPDLEAMQALLAGEAERYTRDKRYVRKNGRELWVRATITLVRDCAGEPDCFVQVASSIDAERSAERGLAAREAQLRTMIETVPVGVVVAEFPSGRIVAGNSYVEQLLRHPVLYSEKVSDYDQWVSYHADGRQVRGEEYPIGRIMLAGEENPSIEVNYQRGDGTFAWIRIIGRPVRDASGEVCGGVVAMVDIDEERKARDHAAGQLESVRAQLIHASRLSAMGTMASTIAHEINQPLAAVASCISGTIARLRKGGAAAAGEAIEWLQRGENITVQAGETIQRLRSMLARGESRRERVPLVRLIEDARAIAMAGGAGAGTDYSQKVDPRLIVEADPVQIQQVLINLIRNSIEVMAEQPQRRLAISARKVGGEVEIEVADNGPGIDSAHRSTLFEPFLSTKPGGMGIGLSICRTIVEAHQGRIWAGDGESGGATLRFTIPAG
jgi:two-component system sensor kinase FixL